MVPVNHHHNPANLFVGNNLAHGMGVIAVTALALHALSNLPKANAIGHFWKAVNEDCYYTCKEVHDWKGLICFSACVALNNYK